MVKEIKGILFDMDGVLVDSFDVWFQLLNFAARKFNYPEIDDAKYETVYGQSVEEDIRIIFPGMKEEIIAEFFQAHFFDYIEHFRTNPEAAEVLLQLQARGVITSVCTNTTTDLAVKILNNAGVRSDFVIGNGDVPNDKPAPDMLFLACEKMGLSTDEVIMVGDSGYDSEAAAAANIFFVGFKRAGDKSIKSLKELFQLL